MIIFRDYYMSFVACFIMIIVDCILYYYVEIKDKDSDNDVGKHL